MNVLITSDDGIDSIGLAILRDAVKIVGLSSHPIVLTSPKPYSGAGMAITSRWQGEVEKAETDTYVLNATPADLIYRAFCDPGLFIKGQWDMVLVGVNHGVNLGFDIWHSGTLGAAITASKGMGCCAMAFSQDLPEGLMDWESSSEAPTRKHFAAAERIVPDFLRTRAPDAGACWNVNIPETATRGYKDAHAAHYSYHRTPPTSLVPRAKNDGSDVDLLLQGFTTVSLLEPRTNPPMQF